MNHKLLEIEKNVFAYFSGLPRHLGFPVSYEFGVMVINCGLETSMFNVVSDTHLIDQDIIAIINQIKRIYKDQPFAWWLGPSYEPKTLVKYLIQQGFVKETTEHAMLCDLQTFKLATSNNNLSIKQVISPKELKDFSNVLEPYDEKACLFYRKLNTLDLENSAYKFFVGYVEERPICMGSLFYHKDLASIWSVITHESMRGKGYGTTMMHHIMLRAQQDGFKEIALLASSEEGFRIYEKLGFEPLGTFECFEWKGSNG